MADYIRLDWIGLDLTDLMDLMDSILLHVGFMHCVLPVSINSRVTDSVLWCIFSVSGVASTVSLRAILLGCHLTAPGRKKVLAMLLQCLVLSFVVWSFGRDVFRCSLGDEV